MTRFERMILTFTIAFVTLFILLLTLNGCATHVVPSATVSVSPVQGLIATVLKSNWLVTVGLLTCAAGVYAFFSGNSKAVAIIAAGIALIGGVAALAAGTELLVAWLPILKWAVPILGVTAVAIWGYNHYYRSQKIKTLADIEGLVDLNNNGKVDVNDLRILLGKPTVVTPQPEVK